MVRRFILQVCSVLYTICSLETLANTGVPWRWPSCSHRQGLRYWQPGRRWFSSQSATRARSLARSRPRPRQYTGVALPNLAASLAPLINTVDKRKLSCRFEYQLAAGVRVATAAVARAGKVLLAGAVAPTQLWDTQPGTLRRVVDSFQLTFPN